MDLGLKGKVAIVSGGSKGMGKASAISLAEEGANVVLCARDSEALEEASVDVVARSSAKQVFTITADMSKSDDIERVFNETMTKWGRIDIAIANVGGPPPGQPTEVTDEQWQAGLELNFMSAVRLSRLAIPVMKKQAYGRIITILSLAIKQPEDNLALSTVSRTATAAFLKTLSTEVASYGITVNAILPGSVETGRLQGVAEMQARFHQRDIANAMKDRLELVPAARFGQPEEVGNLIAFLASERSGFITGLNIPVDGGQLKAMP